MTILDRIEAMLPPVDEKARAAVYAEWSKCRCEGPRPAPLNINDRPHCGRCRRPIRS